MGSARRGWGEPGGDHGGDTGSDGAVDADMGAGDDLETYVELADRDEVIGILAGGLCSAAAEGSTPLSEAYEKVPAPACPPCLRPHFSAPYLHPPMQDSEGQSEQLNSLSEASSEEVRATPPSLE